MNSEQLWLSAEDSYGDLSTELHKINSKKNVNKRWRSSRDTNSTQEPLAADGYLLGMESQFSFNGGYWQVTHASLDKPTPLQIWEFLNGLNAFFLKALNLK